MIDRQEVEQAFVDFNLAFNQHDPAVMASHWAEECDHMEVDGTCAASRLEVEKVFRTLHTGVFKNARLKLNVDSVSVLGPETVVVSGSWELAGALAYDGRLQPALQGHVLGIMIREDEALVHKISRAFVPFLGQRGQIRQAA